MKSKNKYFWSTVYDRTKNNCDHTIRFEHR